MLTNCYLGTIFYFLLLTLPQIFIVTASPVSVSATSFALLAQTSAAPEAADRTSETAPASDPPSASETPAAAADRTSETAPASGTPPVYPPQPVESYNLNTAEDELSTTTVDEGITNVELFAPRYDTPLKRYQARTIENMFWRTEALIFISIPFSFLWSMVLKEFLRNFSVVGAYLEGGRTPVLNSVNFNYSSDDFPGGTADPLDIFTWANLALWPVVVALSDVIDRTSVPAVQERRKRVMRSSRFYRDILYQNF